jgi:hypothetical protein
VLISTLKLVSSKCMALQFKDKGSIASKSMARVRPRKQL